MSTAGKKKLLNKIGYVCFYTGEDLADVPLQSKNGAVSANYPTIEHLIPKSAMVHSNANGIFNLVVAASAVNRAVGHAPLMVKFDVKEYLESITIIQHRDQVLRMTTYASLITKFLMDKYGQLHGYGKRVLPWDWKGVVFYKKMKLSTQKKRRRSLQDAYMKLVTEEEIALGAYIKD